MEIQRQEIFRSQWHDIHDIVLSEAKRQIKFNGKVDVQRLTEKLQKEIAKWPQGVLAQGMGSVAYTHLRAHETGRKLV